MLFFSDNLDCDEHVSYVLSICSQRLYLIKLLHSQGMPGRKLHEIFVALIVSRISYALSAWGGFLTGQQINRIMFFVKYDVLVFVPLQVYVMYRNILASLIVNCSRVYKARPTACLTSHILPPEKNLGGLRSRGHG